MNYLTEKELIFIKALKEDFKANSEKSFLKILFQAEFANNKKLREDLDSLFEGCFDKLFSSSDLMMESVNCRYIGKYKATFWGTGSEGEVFGMGQEIQNLAFNIVCSYYGDVLEPDEKPNVVEYFRNHLGLNYDEYIQSYRDFCRNLGFEYIESFELINKQSEDFERELSLLE